MCGRYSLAAKESRLRQRFSFVNHPELPLAPRYNIAPTQDAVVVVLADDDGRSLASMRWGLIPFWAKDDAIGNKMINARRETLAEKPAFRTAFTKRRCLVLADGFYEWARDGTSKQPVRITMADREPFAFAGLWDRWTRPDATEVRSFTIVTTEPNELLSAEPRAFQLRCLPEKRLAPMCGRPYELKPFSPANGNRKKARLRETWGTAAFAIRHSRTLSPSSRLKSALTNGPCSSSVLPSRMDSANG
jgi:putative SOS response-associated peptidase YedK